MKQLTLSRNEDPVLRKIDRLIEVFITVMFLSITLLVCCSCGSTKVVSQLVKDVRVDTVYLSNTQYDSIYIYKDKLTDHRLGSLEPSGTLKPDTLYIKDVSIEYRYKLLKDTIRVVERDSIPYEVTITEVKEIQRPLTWYDHLSRSVLWLNIGFVIIVIVRLFRKLKPLNF